jgi:hypothetical protein
MPTRVWQRHTRVIELNPCRVARLVEFPERLQVGMNTLLAREQLRPTLACLTSPSRNTARATAIVRSVSSVVSPNSHRCFRLLAYLG